MLGSPLARITAAFFASVATNAGAVSGFHFLSFGMEIKARHSQVLFGSSQRKTVARFLSLSDNGADGDWVQTLPRIANKTMHTVQWITLEETVEFKAFDGETLRTAALRRGLASPHNNRANTINCRGLGTCGTCAVRIEAMQDDNGSSVPIIIEPSERNAVETLRLSLPPGHGSSSADAVDLRLACQVQVRGHVKVTKFAGFWGQDIGVLAKKSLSTQPLGEFEFILDNKSPP